MEQQGKTSFLEATVAAGNEKSMITNFKYAIHVVDKDGKIVPEVDVFMKFRIMSQQESPASEGYY